MTHFCTLPEEDTEILKSTQTKEKNFSTFFFWDLFNPLKIYTFIMILKKDIGIAKIVHNFMTVDSDVSLWHQKLEFLILCTVLQISTFF